MEVTKAGLREIVKGLNMFILFQFLWILTINFFIINSLIELFSKYTKFEFIGIPFEDSILKYNNVIIEFFKQNSQGLLYLAFILFIGGSVVWFITQSIFKNYTFIIRYGSFGIYAAVWIFIGDCTYLLYSLTGEYYSVLLGIGFMIIFYIKNTERYDKIKSFLTNSN